MASIFRSYQSFLARKPLLGNVLTCGVHLFLIQVASQADEQTLFATGDSMSLSQFMRAVWDMDLKEGKQGFG